MPTRRRLIIASVVTLLAGLIILFPARVAYDWFAPPGIRVSGISGSVWSGSASRANVSGVYVANFQWHIKPLRLFTGRVTYVIEGVAGTEISAYMPLQSLQESSGVQGIGGTASAQFEQIVLSNGVPVAAKGTIEVSGLLLPLVSRTSIGGYRADVFTQEDGIVASIEDTDGIVDLAGSLTLAADGAYAFDAQIAPKPETPQQIRDQLRFLGSANERGQYELRLEGGL
jgi:general secretion pathway protein N